MIKDTLRVLGTGRRGACITDNEAELSRCTEERTQNVKKLSTDNLINFKQKASELRIKGSRIGLVASYEASRALAFGMMHLKGEGVVRDPAKAAPFLETAAQGGIAQARHELALLHMAGISVPHDPDYAIHLLEKASADGYGDSTVYLAELYLFGKHCPKDLEAALELLYGAAAKNEPAAMYYLGLVYDVDPDYRNSFEAAYWYRRAAEFGHFKSQIRLTSLYATGEGVPRCIDTAEAFLEVAQETMAEQDPRFLLWQGEHFLKRPETKFLAQALIKGAADLKHAPAQRSQLQHGLARLGF